MGFVRDLGWEIDLESVKILIYNQAMRPLNLLYG